MKFIAAMDNSGGSAGGVLDIYGQEWTEDDKMKKVNQFRLRMVSAPSFTKEKISHAILYKDSVSRGLVEDLKHKGIESILKIDSGTTERGVLKVFDIDGMIKFALNHGCVGTKMRSIVNDLWDINVILDQQFNFAQRISDAGLIPIVEPEIPINSFNKRAAEIELQDQLINRCRDFNGSLILKLTIPDVAETYSKLCKFNSVQRIVGLSGGYSTNEACLRLTRSTHMGASFSRALSEGLKFDQTDEEFNETIGANIEKIFYASSA